MGKEINVFLLIESKYDNFNVIYYKSYCKYFLKIIAFNHPLRLLSDKYRVVQLVRFPGLEGIQIKQLEVKGPFP